MKNRLASLLIVGGTCAGLAIGIPISLNKSKNNGNFTMKEAMERSCLYNKNVLSAVMKKFAGNTYYMKKEIKGNKTFWKDISKEEYESEKAKVDSSTGSYSTQGEKFWNDYSVITYSNEDLNRMDGYFICDFSTMKENEYSTYPEIVRKELEQNINNARWDENANKWVFN